MSNLLILAAVDFSKGSRAALLWAIDLADRSQADLSIVHVIHDPANMPGSYKRTEKEILKPMQAIARQRYDDFMANMLDKRPDSAALKGADILLVKGLPAKRIVSVAKKIKARHIVLGCLGQGKFPNVFVGSVALRVLKKSPLPVTIIKVKAKKKKRSKKEHADKNSENLEA